MKQIAIEAKKREMGKKERNIIRKEGGIPCVVYGKDITSFCISVNERTFEKELLLKFRENHCQRRLNTLISTK